MSNVEERTSPSLSPIIGEMDICTVFWARVKVGGFSKAIKYEMMRNFLRFCKCEENDHYKSRIRTSHLHWILCSNEKNAGLSSDRHHIISDITQ